MPKPNLATAGQTATANSKSRQGATSGPLRIPGILFRLATQIRRLASSCLASILPGSSPRQRRFQLTRLTWPTKAAGLMQLRLLKVDSPELTQFAAQLPVGKIYASGHGFVPQVRTAIYDRLAQFADPAPAPGLPATWDDIDVGHLVIARDELAAGWWEAIVVARDGDMLTVKWRDYPK